MRSIVMLWIHWISGEITVFFWQKIAILAGSPLIPKFLAVDAIPGLVNVYITDGKITMLLIGKSNINGPFSLAMLVYQRVSLNQCRHG